jgi:hypothetical protein
MNEEFNKYILFEDLLQIYYYYLYIIGLIIILINDFKINFYD